MSTPAERIAKARTNNRIPLAWPAKDANEVVDYAIDFTDRLGPCDSIASAAFSLTTAAGLTISASEDDGCSLATVTLSSGTEGSKGKILCRIVTTDGFTLDETVSLLIKAN